MIVTISELQKLFKLSSPRQLKASFRNRIRVFDDGNAEITDERLQELIEKFRKGGSYDVEEVSKLYNIPQATVKHLADINFISAFKLTSSKGSKILFLKEDIEKEKEILLHYSRRKDIRRLARLGETLLQYFSYHHLIPERDCLFFRLYYLEEYTYEEIAIEHGLSRERVRQIVDKSIRRIFIKLSYFIRMKDQMEFYKKRYEWASEKALLYDSVMDLVKLPEEKAKIIEKQPDISTRNLVEFDLSTCALASLHYADIETVGQLVNCTLMDLMKIRNFGKKSLTEVQELLHTLGLSLS
ncbi:MAG TPA: DNA-directed RNA polymerase subunit alpha C-terminal domain-containing protein [Bacteroidia bacterium]|nr:DNA-directed RNA polymerase subunit alpha C-terminal domain-containing protein [Bacteroidia bacterium]